MDLEAWLEKIEAQSPATSIKLGLERMQKFASALDLLKPNAKVITIAGTNGKGSSVATLEQLLLSHGQRVGTYTSPHLLRFNERIKLNGAQVDDKEIINAFELINLQPQSNTLTYFEWVTLAALIIFKSHSLDYILLEVGLGGRFDAVNVIDADIALITSIALDHTEYLGNTREKIAFEKAGIFRKKQIVFCAETDPPSSLLEEAKKLDVFLQRLKIDFTYQNNSANWQFVYGNYKFNFLPHIDLHLNNISNALACFVSLEIPYTDESIIQSLKMVQIFGRGQIIGKKYPILFDVAHNVQSIESLCQRLLKFHQPCLMIFSMLRDKDIMRSIELLTPNVEKWFVAPVNSKRSFTKQELIEIFKNRSNAVVYDSIQQAYEAAITHHFPEVLLCCTGSFLTVAEAMVLSLY